MPQIALRHAPDSAMLNRPLLALATILVVSTPAFAGSVDATPGREYPVTKEHGPWMIFVASFHKPGVDRPDELEQDREDESVARDAAQKLVLELRSKGVPAYIFELQKKREEVQTRDRFGNQQVRRTLADDTQISVLAGNYPSINNDIAEKTLEWIKHYNPESFGDKARFRVTPGRQGPLAGAFLTINPLLSRDEVNARTIDPELVKLLKKLNANNEYPITQCGGDYTLIIKEFRGRSGMKSNSAIAGSWDEKAILKAGESLGKAGYDAWRLCTALRNRGIEAYLWHEEFRSVVTVGAFSSPKDAGIAAYRKRFGAEMQRDPQSGIVRAVFKTEPPTQNGVIPTSAAEDSNFWYFEAQPQVMAVPQLPESRGISIPGLRR